MEVARIIPPELASAVRLGWVPEPVRQIALPAALEAMLGGGLPRGRVCEVVGARGSGRTSLVYNLLAATTAAAEVTAVVDVADAFDPASAARAAIDLAAVLWVRPPSVRDALRCAELVLAAGGFGLVVLDLDGVPLRHLRFYTWPRLARAAEKAGTSLVILAPERLAGSFAVFSLEMSAASTAWSGERRAARPQSVERRDSPKLNPPSSTIVSPPAVLAPPLSPLFESLESYGILVHNKRGPLSAKRRLRWTASLSAADEASGPARAREIRNSKPKTRPAREAR